MSRGVVKLSLDLILVVIEGWSGVDFDYVDRIIFMCFKVCFVCCMENKLRGINKNVDVGLEVIVIFEMRDDGGLELE